MKPSRTSDLLVPTKQLLLGSGVSAALFAPGWLAEGENRPKDGRTMLQLQHDFWEDIKKAIECPQRTAREAADRGRRCHFEG